LTDERTGTVESYDDHAGFGWLAADDGERHWFHCTQVADGSRHVDPGRRVRFSVMAGHLGRWEAAGVEPA
jgi:cold shock CspA family protein